MKYENCSPRVRRQINKYDDRIDNRGQFGVLQIVILLFVAKFTPAALKTNTAIIFD